MATTQLYIPKKCKVGFNLRRDTYSGKLGYIIYNDGKVWRKETSWESWRQKEGDKTYDYDSETRKNREYFITGVEPIEFDNIPTEGFVLNKKVGGYSSGWNHRQTYSRIYDPRGWEFEITVPNLLYILQECSSFKGKGLEGQFVYSWDGKDLVLLPVSSPDYIASEEYTKLQSQKIGVKDLVEGCVYITSKQNKLLYLGKHKVKESESDNITEIEAKDVNKNPFELKYVFKKLDGDEHYMRYYSYEFLGSLGKLKEKVSDEIHPDFANKMDKFLKSGYVNVNPADHLEVREFTNKEMDEIPTWNRERFYRINTIKTYQDYLSSRVFIRKVQTGYEVSTEKANKPYWHDDFYTVGTYDKDHIKSNYGKLVRVYKNGLKKDV